MKSLLLLAVTTGLVSAQSNPPELAVFLYTDVIPSMTSEFEASAAVARDVFKKNGTPFRLVYTKLFGAGPRLSIAPLSDLSSWDNGNPLRKMMGEQAYQKWLPQYMRSIATVPETLLVRPLQNAFIADAPRGSLPVLVVQRTRVAVDRRAEFEARVRDVVVPALKKAGVKRYVISRVVFGGGSNEYISARSHSGLVEAEKVNQVIASLPMPAGMFLSSERSVYRINPTLSYSPGVEIK